MSKNIVQVMFCLTLEICVYYVCVSIDWLSNLVVLHIFRLPFHLMRKVSVGNRLAIPIGKRQSRVILVFSIKKKNFFQSNRIAFFCSVNERFCRSVNERQAIFDTSKMKMIIMMWKALNML